MAWDADSKLHRLQESFKLSGSKYLPLLLTNLKRFQPKFWSVPMLKFCIVIGAKSRGCIWKATGSLCTHNCTGTDATPRHKLSHLGIFWLFHCQTVQLYAPPTDSHPLPLSYSCSHMVSFKHPAINHFPYSLRYLLPSFSQIQMAKDWQ